MYVIWLLVNVNELDLYFFKHIYVRQNGTGGHLHLYFENK